MNNPAEGSRTSEERCNQTLASNAIPSDGEMQEVYAKLNSCKIKAVAHSNADQFIEKGRTLPTIPHFFEVGNLELD